MGGCPAGAWKDLRTLAAAERFQQGRGPASGLSRSRVPACHSTPQKGQLETSHLQWSRWEQEPPAVRQVPSAHLVGGGHTKSVSLYFLGYHENGVVKAENGASPRTKKLKSP